MISRRFAIACSVALIAASVFTFAPPARAAEQTAEPAVLNLAWWWKDAQSETRGIGGNQVEVTTPSPFCPAAPGSLGEVPGACAVGRFPVEIRGGDYEEPNMLSALGFDLSYLTPGSEVFKFELKLLEAESGCYDGPDEGDECTPGNPSAEGDHIEHTDPIGPVDERGVKACLVTEIFGDGDGRPYRELPRYECADDAPVATRKEIKTVDPDTDDDEIDHIWTFDLTSYAEEWAKAFAVSTAIMLVGEGPEEPEDNDTWRVVFAGPRAEKGVQAKLVYEPSEIAPPPPPPPTTTDPGVTGGTSTTSFGGGTTGTPSFGGTDTGTGTDAGSSAPAPAEVPGLETAGAEGPDIEEMPAYMWIAFLAGLIAFTMVRQVVVEKVTGIRPDGVLAKIHALNAERRGLDLSEVAATGPSALAGVASIGGAIRRRFSSLLSKIPGRG